MKLFNNISVLAVILARGGSKGFPQKNIMPLMGKPLLTYTIDAAKKSKKIDYIALSTDDENIASIAEKEDIKVIKRPVEYATDQAPMHLALLHAVQNIEKRHGNVDYVVSLYANIPLRRNGIIDEAVEKIISTSADSVESFVPCMKPPQWAFKIDEDTPSFLHPEYEFAYRRQMLQPAFFPDGSVIVVKRDVLINCTEESAPRDFLGKNRKAVVSSPIDSVDIDSQIDMLWAEFLLKHKSQGGHSL